MFHGLNVSRCFTENDVSQNFKFFLENSEGGDSREFFRSKGGAPVCHRWGRGGEMAYYYE